MGTIFDRPPSPSLQMDESTNRDMWQRIVDNSMVGVGVFSKAAICSMRSGRIYACAPPEFDPSVAQVKNLAAAVLNPSKLAATGIEIDDLHFQYHSGQVGQTLYGIDPNVDHRGVIISTGNKCMVIAVYEKDEKEAKKMLSELLEYFSSQYDF